MKKFDKNDVKVKCKKIHKKNRFKKLAQTKKKFLKALVQ